MFGRGGKESRSAGASAGLSPGLMQDHPINLVDVLAHAAKIHSEQLIVSALAEGGRHRQSYAETYVRAGQAAHALSKLGVRPGDRVGTLAWNGHRHLEAWYAISGQGAICHTVNPRLAPSQIGFIVNHAEDRVLLADAMFAPLIGELRPHLKTVEHVVYLTDAEHMPAGDEALCYEQLLAGEPGTFDWPRLPEETASSLCYTSGTTGDPKGVLYSHRSNVLMAYAICGKDAMDLGAADVSLMIVPMFHANAWGLVYAGPMVGARLVLPGPALDGASVHALIKEEGVTSAAAVPTVWAMLLRHLEAAGGDLAPLREVTIGGAAVPRAMARTLLERYRVGVAHGWGMTELSPVGTVNRAAPGDPRMTLDEQLDRIVKQGKPLFGVELKIVDEEGRELPRDGKAAGRLLTRGPWVAKAYYKSPAPILDADGWFDTGDVATIDAQGVMAITDRAKDVIKSGGEWISSVDLENRAMGAPGVQLACAVGVAHPKWGERPLLLVTARAGETPDPESVLAHIAQGCAKWQLPDAVLVVDELPLTGIGKLDKKVLRAQYADYFAKVEA